MNSFIVYFNKKKSIGMTTTSNVCYMMDKFFKYYEKLAKDGKTNKCLIFRSKYDIQKWMINEVRINANQSARYAWLFKGLMVSFKDFKLHKRIGKKEKPRKFFNNLMHHAKFDTETIHKKSCILYNIIT